MMNIPDLFAYDVLGNKYMWSNATSEIGPNGTFLVKSVEDDKVLHVFTAHGLVGIRHTLGLD